MFFKLYFVFIFTEKFSWHALENYTESDQQGKPKQIDGSICDWSPITDYRTKTWSTINELYIIIIGYRKNTGTAHIKKVEGAFDILINDLRTRHAILPFPLANSII